MLPLSVTWHIIVSFPVCSHCYVTVIMPAWPVEQPQQALKSEQLKEDLAGNSTDHEC
jgi:hypothetical protein